MTIQADDDGQVRRHIRRRVSGGAAVNVLLARRLDVPEAAVRSLVDADHSSWLNGVVQALSVLGRGMIIHDQKQVAA